MDIFISYAREDAESASRLYHALQGISRVTPWLDSKKLLPGARWELAIMEALKSCDLFILLLSSKSVAKTGFVQKEILEALEKLQYYPPDQIFLVPARLDDCKPKHPELHDLHWVDLFPDWNGGFRRILDVVEDHLSKPIELPIPAKDVVFESVNSQESFDLRLKARGELRGVDAMDINFFSFDFSKFDLCGASFVRCQFTDCNFSRTLLRSVNFEGANFDNCNFSNTDLFGVNFWGANIIGIQNLEQALLEQTNFFRTTKTIKQSKLILDSNALSLEDYGTFYEYFITHGGMSTEEFAETFLWFNHRYFRRMFTETEAT